MGKTVDDIMKLNHSMPKLEEGQMFSFASQGERVQKMTEALLRRLGALASAAIRKGVALEWGRANEECDKLVKSVVGKAILNDATRYKAYTKRNLDAMRAFQNRSEGGMNLSERVWKSVEQLKEEMEVAITVSMGEGKCASGMAREVRQCLNDPDLMFRRFRYKIAEKEVRDAEGNVVGKETVWGRKWKKRVRDEKTGRYRFIDYDRDDYKVGRGVYKSAVRNAMRVARTETNMAYRRADGERWRQMDFVLGQRIHLSGKHPKKDICDRLAGDYPKDFVFTGWHPHCFCYVTPILASEEEMARENEAWARGEEYKARGEEVRDVPEAFKEWVREKGDALRKGNAPYFVRDNMGVVEGILNPQPTIAELAKARHEARTEEEIEEIKKRWEEHNKKIALTKKTADNVLKVAKDMPELDYSALEKAVGDGNYTAMNTEAKAVAKALSELKKRERTISDLIPDVHNWHNLFGIADLETVHKAVRGKLDTLSKLTLEEQKKKLLFEANEYLGTNKYGAQTKFPTWEVSKSAYLKRLKVVELEIAKKDILAKLPELEAYAKKHPKAAKFASMLDDAKKACAESNEIAEVQGKFNYVFAEYQKRLAQEAKKNAGKGSIILSPISDKDKTKLLSEFQTSQVQDIDNLLRPYTENRWVSLSDEEKLVLTKYTQTYCYLNEPLRGLKYSGSVPKSEYTHDLPLLTSALSKFTMPKDMVVRRGTKDFPIAALNKNLSQVSKGDVFVDGGFLSTSVHRTTGFFQTINLVILVPKGAQGAFAECFTHYNDNNKYNYGGNGTGKKNIWNGKAKETLGSEFEWIGQRGSKFRVLDKQGKTIYLEMIGQLNTQ